MDTIGAVGVRFYTAPPLIPDRPGLARAQARLWADEDLRLMTARSFAVDPARLAPGTWCHVRDRQIGKSSLSEQLYGRGL